MCYEKEHFIQSVPQFFLRETVVGRLIYKPNSSPVHCPETEASVEDFEMDFRG